MSPLTGYLVETLVTLVAVVLLAVLVLWGGRRLGLGRASGGLELLGKLPLDPRRAVYLVRVGKLVYVVGASEGGLVRLGELPADEVPSAPPGGEGEGGVRAVLARVRGTPSKGEASVKGEGEP